MQNLSKTVKIEVVFTRHHFNIKWIHLMYFCCFGTFKVQVFFIVAYVFNIYMCIMCEQHFLKSDIAINWSSLHNTAFFFFLWIRGVFDYIVFCMQNTSKTQRKNVSVFSTLLLCKRTWRNKLIYILGGLRVSIMFSRFSLWSELLLEEKHPSTSRAIVNTLAMMYWDLSPKVIVISYGFSNLPFPKS